MIKLDNEYYVTADTRSFMLNRKYKPDAPKNKLAKSRDEAETVVGYYGNIANVINAYRKEQMLKWVGSERLSLEQLCDRINEMDAAIGKKLSRLKVMDLGEDTKPRRRNNKEKKTEDA